MAPGPGGGGGQAYITPRHAAWSPSAQASERCAGGGGTTAAGTRGRSMVFTCSRPSRASGVAGCPASLPDERRRAAIMGCLIRGVRATAVKLSRWTSYRLVHERTAQGPRRRTARRARIRDRGVRAARGRMGAGLEVRRARGGVLRLLGGRAWAIRPRMGRNRSRQARPQASIASRSIRARRSSNSLTASAHVSLLARG